MSTWINKKKTALLAPLLISACVAMGGGQTVPAAVPGGVALAGPSGFCLVESTRQSAGDRDLAAFRRCGDTAAPDAVLTVVVGTEGSARGLDPSAEAMGAYFNGPEGRQALSRSGDAETVTVHELRDADGALLIRLSDQSQPGGADNWRAVTVLRDRIVTLGVRSPSDGPALPGAEAERLIQLFLTAMRDANVPSDGLPFGLGQRA